MLPDTSAILARLLRCAGRGEKVEALVMSDSASAIDNLNGSVRTNSSTGVAGVVRIWREGLVGHAFISGIDSLEPATALGIARVVMRPALAGEVAHGPLADRQPTTLGSCPLLSTAEMTEHLQRLQRVMETGGRHGRLRLKSSVSTGAIGSSAGGGLLYSESRSSRLKASLRGAGHERTCALFLRHHDLEVCVRALTEMSAEEEDGGGAAPWTRRGRISLVLAPPVVAQFMAALASALCSDRMTAGHSFLRLRQAVPWAELVLADDPTDERGPRAGAFDHEGVAARSNVLVAGGEVAGVLHTRGTAAAANVAPTGSARYADYRDAPRPRASTLNASGGDALLDQLIGAVDVGIRVDSISGLRSSFNVQTGDFSVVGQGRRVLSGRLTTRVAPFIYSGNILRMLGRVAAATRGCAVDAAVGAIVPHLLVEAQEIAAA